LSGPKTGAERQQCSCNYSSKQKCGCCYWESEWIDCKEYVKKEAALEIKTGQVTYTLLATQINIDAVSAQIGKQVKLSNDTFLEVPLLYSFHHL